MCVRECFQFGPLLGGLSYFGVSFIRSRFHCIPISGWLFERNRAIGKYFKITLTIILLSWSY